MHQDVGGGALLADALAYHRPHAVHLIVLCPRPDVVAEREARRAKVGYRALSEQAFDRVFREETPQVVPEEVEPHG